VLGLALAVAAGPAFARELVVGAEVSLREPLLEIAARHRDRRPEVDLRLVFGSSSTLGMQIRAGAKIDVFLSADERIVEDLASEGWVSADGHSTLARNRLVVIAPPESPIRVDEPRDLAAVGVERIAVAGPAVPVGRYAREWLGARGLLDLLARRVVQTEHARATLAAVELGHADLALVYATDAALSDRARIVYEIPRPEQPRIVYAAARVGGRERSAATHTDVEAFLAELRGPETRAALRRAGFEVDDPPPSPSPP